MSITLEKTVKSLKDFIDLEVADFFVVDCSALGTNLLPNNEVIDLNYDRAVLGGVNLRKIRESIVCAEASLKLFEEYSCLVSTETIYEEFLAKLRVEEQFRRTYEKIESARRRKTEIFRRGKKVIVSELAGQHKSKELKGLEKLYSQEEELGKVLRDRMVQRDPQYSNLRLLVRSTTPMGVGGNRNDENIVADSLNLALSKKKPVAIVTRDCRFRDILIRTQKSIINRGFNVYSNALKGPLISIIRGNRDGFNLDYCSQDFYEIFEHP